MPTFPLRASRLAGWTCAALLVAGTALASPPPASSPPHAARPAPAAPAATPHAPAVRAPAKPAPVKALPEVAHPAPHAAGSVRMPGTLHLRPTSAPAPVVTLREPSAPLDRGAIRATNDRLTDEAFAKKWTAAVASPLLFFRSFPAAYYRDLKAVVARGVPGGRGVILGDPHPENFGFVKTAGGTEFVFNDFDDAGKGPVAVDALRYFTALRLTYPDKPHVVARALEAYVDAVQHGKAEEPPGGLKPHWSDLRDDNLKRYTSGREFRLGGDTRLSAPPAKVAAAVRGLVESDPRFEGARVLDVAHRERDYGGSGGLERVWVLVKKKGDEPRIVELKETTAPATSELGGAQLAPGERLGTLKQTFLKAPPEDDLFAVQLGDKRFFVRDRARMASVPLEELSKDDRNDLFRAQVSVMANVHREGWSGVDAAEIKSWLSGSSEMLAGRWAKAYEAAKSER